MNDLELTELYERSKDDRAIIVGSEIRDAIGTLREVVAEKDAEIAVLEAVLDGFGYHHKLDASTGGRIWFKYTFAEPRKVSDAQREVLLKMFEMECDHPDQLLFGVCKVIESPADVETTK